MLRRRLEVWEKEFSSQFNEYAELNLKMTKELPGKIVKVAEVIAGAYRSGNKVMLMGNGGNGADAEHMAGELVGRVKNSVRPGLPAIAITANTTSLTAIGNDFGFEHIFYRQVEAFGKQDDVAIGFSSSGNSKNIIKAFELAKTRGIKTVSFTGGDGGILSKIADFNINIPSHTHPRIQEAHLTVSHMICEYVEQELFGNKSGGTE
jgi:D-sedoheptulose 7-phosphate isomerase